MKKCYIECDVCNTKIDNEYYLDLDELQICNKCIERYLKDLYNTKENIFLRLFHIEKNIPRTKEKTLVHIDDITNKKPYKSIDDL